ncbi:MAG TPA: tetratricopeptide repeat protein [Caulobacteraceae bacterium]|nr:tetratricopeptide repeat protein [Caulobacteraceae bacterium]
MTGQAPASGASRAARLIGYLEQDPGNLGLLASAAQAAYEEGDLAAAATLLARHVALEPLTPALRNLDGLVRLRSGRVDEAAEIFSALSAESGGAPELRFNLAWCEALRGDFAAVDRLIDETVAAAAPRAAALKVEALHHLGRLEDGLAFGLGFAEQFVDDRDLAAAIALVALDLEETDLARQYAARADGAGEALSTLGVLALGDGDADQALAIFDRALGSRPGSPRALLGKGLALMQAGRTAEGTLLVEKGAETFGDHLGSWIAAGWGRFAQGDRAGARAVFEKALALDDGFAESHGALAVLDVLDGDLASGERRTAVALRLDRQCFSAALARSLLLAAAGDESGAERVRTIALNTPIGPDGKTIADALVAIAPKRR